VEECGREHDPLALPFGEPRGESVDDTLELQPVGPPLDSRVDVVQFADFPHERQILPGRQKTGWVLPLGEDADGALDRHRLRDGVVADDRRAPTGGGALSGQQFDCGGLP